MIARVQKWGRGQGLRLSKELLRASQIEVGDVVDVRARAGSLVITPARSVPGSRSLEELVVRIPDDYRPRELHWGSPTGSEVW